MFTTRSKKVSSREPDTLPRGWDEMSVTGLWSWLNDPRRFSTPPSTIDAIVYAVQARGTAALKEPAIVHRLASCDAAARADIKRKIIRGRS
jgi:hypothetical protein